MQTLEEKAHAFLLHVTSRSPGWYAHRAAGEEPGEEENETARDRDVA
jgi:hypothetical protein